MKATVCLMAVAFASIVCPTVQRGSNRLYDVLTGSERIAHVTQTRFGDDVDENFERLRRKGINGFELINLARDILEGAATREGIEGCQLVQRAKALVFGRKNATLPLSASELSKDEDFIALTDVLRDIGIGLKQAAICKACVISVDLILLARRSLKLDKQTIFHMFNLLCGTLGKSIIGGKTCFGLVDMNIDSILYITDKCPDVGTKMCGVVLQNYGCGSKLVPGNWSIQIDKGQPKPILDTTNKIKQSESYKVLHITDIHYDPFYAPNVTANCDEVMLCCQEDDAMALSEEEKSGFWTDYRSCDIPARFVDEALHTIKQNEENITHIYFTGDVISHRAWNIDTMRNIRDLRFIMGMIKGHFPYARIYPILGNHESHPLNLYPPSDLEDSEFSIVSFFDAIADLWKDFLPEGTDLETVRRGGFYTVKEEGQPRIIALNSNVGYTLNYWLIYKENDYYDQLQWLSDTLHEAEKARETVHILTHIPSGSNDAYIGWSRQFQKIIERYHHVIAGIFSGHTHLDELYVYYKDEQPITMGFNGGSLTPYVDVNPNYKMLTVASDTYEIVDIDEYYVNVTEANIKKTLKWQKLYSLKNEYNLSQLSPKNLHNLVAEMARNSTLRNVYRKNLYRLGPAMKEECDRNCHQTNLCNIVTNVFSDQRMCNKLKYVYT